VKYNTVEAGRMTINLVFFHTDYTAVSSNKDF